MSIQVQVQKKLEQALSPNHLEVINESHMHRVPPGSESHFKLVVVTPLFEQKRLLQRHRMVNEILAEELAEDIHALAMHTYTPDEWSTRQAEAPLSPNCRGN